MLLVAPQTTSCKDFTLVQYCHEPYVDLKEMGRATVTPKCQKIFNIQTCFHMDQKMCHIKIQSLLSTTVTTLE